MHLLHTLDIIYMHLNCFACFICSLHKIKTQLIIIFTKCNVKKTTTGVYVNEQQHQSADFD